MNPDDARRDQILRFLYERHRSARGPSAIPIGIRDLQSEMKKRHGMSQQEVAHNLDYLIQVGWAREVVKERDFTTPGGMRLRREQAKYKISDVGINNLEAASLFNKPPVVPQINITNIEGVTVVGDGNVVNASLTDLSAALDQLQDAVLATPQLSEEQKLNAFADIATMKSQIAKQSPSRSILDAAWKSLQVLAGVAALADLMAKIAPLVGLVLGGG